MGLAHVELDTVEMLASVVDLLLEREHIGIFLEFLSDRSQLLRIDLLLWLLAFFLPCLVRFSFTSSIDCASINSRSVRTIPAIIF